MNIFYFILLPIFFTVIGEFLLKYGVMGISTGEFIGVLALVTNIEIIVGVALIVSSALLWIIGMSKFQLSFMYPFLSLNYVLIIVGSELILNENVQMNRYISILLIIIGLVFVSKSTNIKIKE